MEHIWGLSSQQRKGTHRVSVDAGQAAGSPEGLVSAQLQSRAKFKHQNAALGAQGIAQPSSPVAASSQSSLWQGRSFCFPWTLGQLGIITAAKPSLPQHNEAVLSIPRCAEGKCPVWPFLVLPFQMWRGRGLETAGCQPREERTVDFCPGDPLDLTACG